MVVSTYRHRVDDIILFVSIGTAPANELASNSVILKSDSILYCFLSFVCRFVSAHSVFRSESNWSVLFYY